MKLHWITTFLMIAIACKEAPKKEAPVLALPVVRALSQDVPIKKEFVGEIMGITDIPIRARVNGVLEGVHFQEGGTVKKGQLLYTIDPLPYQTKVSSQKSSLAESRIQAANAENELNRIRPLAEVNAVSKSDLDAAITTDGAAKAAVDASAANLKMAEIELSYCRIESPIDGVIGKTAAKQGEFVGQYPNPVILNTVSDISQIRVQFFISENQYLDIARRNIELQKAGEKSTRNRELELILSDGAVFKQKGKLDFIDRNVDPATGALLIQATFPNPDKLIRPGQFGRIRAEVETFNGAVLIPQRCVREVQGRFDVFVINDSSKVELRNVDLGPTYKDFWIVTRGLKAGDRVLLEGLQKVREGLVIKPEEVQFESKFKD